MHSYTQAKHLSNSALVFLIAAPIIIVNYLIFIVNPSNAGHPVAYTLQLVADFFSIITVTGLWLTILLDALVPSHQHDVNKGDDEFVRKRTVTVDIFIPVAGEPIDVIRQTAKGAVEMYYPHRTFILDDGKSDDVRDLAEELGITYIRRTVNKNAKSGNVNNALSHGTGDFFCNY